MKTNFVLVDFENVQPKNVSLLNGGPFKIKVFLGANQAKISLEIACALQTFGPDAEYIQIDGHGRNALDFHIAYYIGRLAAEAPDAYFHVISKDTGFDPLIKHLKLHGILPAIEINRRYPSRQDIQLRIDPGEDRCYHRQPRKAQGVQASNTQNAPKYHQCALRK